MANVTDWRAYRAAGAIEAYRLVHPDTADGAVAQANADTDPLIGVSGSRAVVNDETVEVAIAGTAQVEYGGAVARGALLTSDGDGKAVATTTAGRRICGIALWTGVDGDIGEILLSPGSV